MRPSTCAGRREPDRAGHPAGLVETGDEIDRVAMQDQGHLSIAVVIPNYNRPRLVAEAIESVLAQTRPADEVVVVDDGSRERSELTVQSFGGRVGYIYQVNRGLAGARNTGIRETRSDLLTFLDDDDLLEPNHLEDLAVLLEADPTLSVAYGEVVYTDLVGHELGIHSRIVPEIRDAEGFPSNALSLRCFPPIHSVIFRRRVFEKHGFFNETYPYAEDVEMWLRIAPHERFAFLDRVVCRYRKHEENMVRDLWEMEEHLTQAVRERFNKGDLSADMAKLAGTAFANLCLTQVGHYVRSGVSSEVVRCVRRVRRASGCSRTAFWLLLLREFTRRRMVRWFRRW